MCMEALKIMIILGSFRTKNRSGIRNSDWFVTAGGDGFQVRVDPTDPNILYTMSQYGYNEV